ncbi:MAG TPA: hypothetical protein VK680_08750 [Solirubrobacteraceae bacterium]|jgi:hypothetical protein|nr:hypothetical protein [Solirubrobacteraceae bacterium]
MRARQGLGAILVLVVVFVACGAQHADAVILPAVTIDGPNSEIVSFGGVAMAEDGTGGLVYLKKVNGIAHVFVSRYFEGHWQTPIRVDTGDQYAASSPRIGAADGGQLVAVWSTPFATVKERPVSELLSATLGPGASQFQEPVIVDPNIGEGTDVSPEIAMNPSAQAYVVYRVVEPFSLIPKLHAGDVGEQVRVARYRGHRWALLGAINRDPGVSMRPPASTNAPQVAIARNGEGIVVWQEPEINGVARIWARRLFANSIDYVLPATATSINGKPIDEDADAPSVAISLLGGADVAYRQTAAPSSPLGGARIFLNKLPDGESENGAEFKGAVVADASVPGGINAQIGPPSVDVDEHQELRLLYDSDGTPQVVEGNGAGVFTTPTLGPAFSGPEEPSASVMNPQGGGVSAWISSTPLGSPAVAVREDFPEGAVQTGLVSGGAGGPISELSVGRSGLGDGLIAFQQGATGDAAIVASQATAPPAELILNVARGWLKPAQASVSWTPAVSADGPITYALVLDGRKILTTQGLQAKIEPQRLGNGIHHLQLLATDIDGQSTLSAPSTLSIERTPPIVKVSHTQGGYIVVRVLDSYSGVDTHLVSVSFGDGQHASGRTRFRHHYARRGIYQLVVHVRSKVGNAGVVSELVSIR